MSVKIPIIKKAKLIFNELNINPYDCDLWHKFSTETGDWGLGILKTVVCDDPNSYMLTSIDANALKNFLLENPIFYSKYKIK